MKSMVSRKSRITVTGLKESEKFLGVLEENISNRAFRFTKSELVELKERMLKKIALFSFKGDLAESLTIIERYNTAKVYIQITYQQNKTNLVQDQDGYMLQIIQNYRNG